MAEFRFANVKPAKPVKRGRRSKPIADQATVDLTAEGIAKLIDPDAWAEEFAPGSKAHLQAQLDDALKQIEALREELQWLTADPSTPEGSYQQMLGERRKEERLRQSNDPTILRLKEMQIATASRREIKKQQKASLAKAQEIIKLSKKAYGSSRSTLVIVRGAGKARYFRQKNR